jgi:hypothetical protein
MTHLNRHALVVTQSQHGDLDPRPAAGRWIVTELAAAGSSS